MTVLQEVVEVRADLFPNPASCLRLVRALCAEVHEGWLEDHRYLNMEYLKEQKRALRTAASPITALTTAMKFFLHNLTYTTGIGDHGGTGLALA